MFGQWAYVRPEHCLKMLEYEVMQKEQEGNAQMSHKKLWK